MRIALDTNILAYAEGVGYETRRNATLDLLDRLPDDDIVLPVQTLGELFQVLTIKERRPPSTVREAILGWADTYDVADSSWRAFQAAFDLCADHGLSFWDALILAVAAEQRCRLLLSEDMQPGFTWQGVTIVNPYSPPLHPLLEIACDSRRP